MDSIITLSLNPKLMNERQVTPTIGACSKALSVYTNVALHLFLHNAHRTDDDDSRDI